MVMAEIIRIFAAFIAVLGLIGLCALAAKKAGLVAASGGFSKKRRLALVETLALDPKRRVAIIKCDGAEHLIVLGATSETVIDKNLPPAPEQENDDAEAETTAGAFGRAQANPFAALRAFANGETGKSADAA